MSRKEGPPLAAGCNYFLRYTSTVITREIKCCRLTEQHFLEKEKNFQQLTLIIYAQACYLLANSVDQTRLKVARRRSGKIGVSLQLH